MPLIDALNETDKHFEESRKPRESDLMRLLCDLRQLMRDNQEYGLDTAWVGPAETLFDRLVELYENYGGDMEELRAEWPEYLGT